MKSVTTTLTVLRAVRDNPNLAALCKPKLIKAAFAVIDANGDHVISWEEFKRRFPGIFPHFFFDQCHYGSMCYHEHTIPAELEEQPAPGQPAQGGGRAGGVACSQSISKLPSVAFAQRGHQVW